MNVIYKIQINDRYYLGSTNNFNKRKHQHLSKLRGKYHANRFLQNLFDKYGIDSFQFSIIEKVPIDIGLIEREQEYLDIHYGTENCVNLSPVAGGGWVYKATPESIAKGIETKRRNGTLVPRMESYRYPKEMIESNKGRKHKDLAKRKISDGNKKSYANSEKRKKACKENGINSMKERWERYNKPFVLIKDEVEYGPYKLQMDAIREGVITSYHMGLLFRGLKDQINGMTIRLLFN